MSRDVFACVLQLQSLMLTECAGRTPEVEETPGRLVGAHWYYSKRGPGQQYWVKVRRAAAPLDDSQTAGEQTC